MSRTLDMDGTGLIIKTLCRERGITVDFLVDTLNVSRQAVYGWFSARKLPTVDHLVELADILEVPIDDLVATREYISGG